MGYISGCYSNYNSNISTVGLLAERYCSINSTNIIEALTVMMMIMMMMMMMIIIIIILNTCHRVRKILAEQ